MSLLYGLLHRKIQLGRLTVISHDGAVLRCRARMGSNHHSGLAGQSFA